MLRHTDNGCIRSAPFAALAGIAIVVLLVALLPELVPFPDHRLTTVPPTTTTRTTGPRSAP